MNDKEFAELQDRINYHVGQLNKLQKIYHKETGKFMVTNAWTESTYVPRAERIISEITDMFYGLPPRWYLNNGTLTKEDS